MSMEDILAPRSFIQVTNRIMNVLEYEEKTPDETYERRIMVCWIYSKNLGILKKKHIFKRIYRHLVEKEAKDIMTLREYNRFVLGIRKIQRDGIYLDPRNQSLLWEKLAKLCSIHLKKYRYTSWGIKVSRIIRNLE